MQLYFRVNIVNDTDPEVTEEFMAGLTTNQDRVLLEPNEMIVEIVDDDSKPVHALSLLHSFSLN